MIDGIVKRPVVQERISLRFGSFVVILYQYIGTSINNSTPPQSSKVDVVVRL